MQPGAATPIKRELFRLLPLLFLLFCLPVNCADNLTLQSLLDNPAILKALLDIEQKNKQARASLADLNNKQAAVTEEISGIAVGEELLLSLYVDKNYLSDLYAFKSKQNAQIGLSSLFELLDFPICVDLHNHQAKGWFINEDKIFQFNWSADNASMASVTVNNKTSHIAKKHYRIESDNIYVDADTIAQWFDFEMQFNFNDLKVQLSSATALPIQQRLARQKKQIATSRSNKPTLPWKESSYQAISAPLIDLQLNASTNKNSAAYGSYSVLASHDLAFLNSQLFASGNKNDSLSDLRMTFTREDRKGELLGLLNASKYQFGDITPVKTAIGNTGGISRGFLVSNQALTNNNNNRSTTFSGNIQPGWDIELYRNGILIAREVSLQNGRYDFKDIELLFGDNQFELIFYGPQGQVRSEKEQFYIDSNALKAKQSDYAFSAVEVGETLFGISSSNSTRQPGWLSTAVYNQGITNWFSMHGGVDYLSATEGENRQNYSIGTNLSLFRRFLLSADFQQDNQAHQKLVMNGRTQIGKHALSLNYQQQDNFFWKTPNDINFREELAFNMAGNLFRHSFSPVNYQNTWRQTRSNKTAKTDELTNQLSFYTPIAAVTHQLSWKDYQNASDDSQSVTGFLRLQRSFGRLYSRLQGSYEIKPEQQFKQISSEFSYPLALHLQSELELDYFPVSEQYRTQLGLNWQYDSFSVNASINYNSDDFWSAGLFTRFSFGYDPLTNQYFASRRALANSGALMVRVYEDKNLNKQFERDEPLIEGVKIKGLQNHQQAKTDEDGIAVLHSLANNQTSDIILDKDSLEDPFLIPALPGVSLTPRRGFIDTLEFPVVTASELEGTVYIRDLQGKEKEAAYVKILLHNKEGQLIASTESEFDGYYLFTDLLPGEYRVSVEAAYSKRKRLQQAKEIDVKLSGDVVNGADFVLNQLEFIKGYVVSLGNFNSETILKSYWLLIKNSYDNALQQQAFYMFDPQTQKYSLNAGFFKNKKQADRACYYLVQKSLNCQVQAFEFSSRSKE